MGGGVTLQVALFVPASDEEPKLIEWGDPGYRRWPLFGRD
jgi:hypothetical protein